ncbi:MULTISPECIES: S-layer homology domain-containing protein [unclassified Bilifractor]|uniref:S-layer homology domain-containing protein n=1 Tax=unclassified Bilifractor TaxID=2815795 RepID=UPI003F931CE7
MEKLIKKIEAIILTIVFFFSIPTIVSANELTFSDVPTNAYYYDSVNWAVSKGITSGTGNGKFSPNSPCTRGQMAVFLWRMSGSPQPMKTSGFSDISSDQWDAKAISWAVENGIASGVGHGKFDDKSACTRGQMAVFLWRIAGSPDPSNLVGFSDVSSTQWNAKAIYWAKESGITKGIGAGKYGESQACTRCQMVTFLKNSTVVSNRAPVIVESGYTVLPADSLSNVYATYGVKIQNPNDLDVPCFYKLHVTVRSENGAVVRTYDDYIPYIAPGDTVYMTNDLLSCNQDSNVTLEFSVNGNTFNSQFDDSLAKSTDFTVSNINETTDSIGYNHVTGEIISNLDTQTDNVVVEVLYYYGGKIVGGAYTYLDSISARSGQTFEITEFQEVTHDSLLIMAYAD